MPEDVKIVIRQESQGDALPRTKTQLDDVADSSKRAKDALDKVGSTKPMQPAPAQPAKPAKPAAATAASTTGVSAGSIDPKQVAADRVEDAKQKLLLARASRNEELIDKRERGLLAETKRASHFVRPHGSLQSQVTSSEIALANAKAERRPQEEIDQLSGQLRSRKLAVRFMREQKLSEKDALEKADSLVMAQDGAKQTAAEDKAAARASAQEKIKAEKDAARESRMASREKVRAERDASKELREQETTQRRIANGTITMGRELINGGSVNSGLGSILGAAGVFGAPAAAILSGGMLVQNLTQDYMERQGISNRDRANRATDARSLLIRGGWRGTSAQAQASQFRTEDEIFQHEQERAEILRRNKRAWYNPLRLFGETTWAGLRERDENERNLQRKRERRDKEEQQAREKFDKEEGGLELDALRQRSTRTLPGFRRAMVDDYTRQWAAEYRRFRSMGADDSKASEGANLTVQNELRGREGHIGNALVDARSGQADIAAAARWAQTVSGSWGDIKGAVDAMHATMRTAWEKSNETRTRETWQ